MGGEFDGGHKENFNEFWDVGTVRECQVDESELTKPPPLGIGIAVWRCVDSQTHPSHTHGRGCKPQNCQPHTTLVVTFEASKVYNDFFPAILGTRLEAVFELRTRISPLLPRSQ